MMIPDANENSGEDSGTELVPQAHDPNPLKRITTVNRVERMMEPLSWTERVRVLAEIADDPAATASDRIDAIEILAQYAGLLDTPEYPSGAAGPSDQAA